MKKLFEMKDEDNARLIRLAKEKGMTRSGMMKMVVEKGLAYYEKKKDFSKVEEPKQMEEKQETKTEQEAIEQPSPKDDEDPLDILARL